MTRASVDPVLTYMAVAGYAFDITTLLASLIGQWLIMTESKRPLLGLDSRRLSHHLLSFR